MWIAETCAYSHDQLDVLSVVLEGLTYYICPLPRGCARGSGQSNDNLEEAVLVGGRFGLRPSFLHLLVRLELKLYPKSR